MLPLSVTANFLDLSGALSSRLWSTNILVGKQETFSGASFQIQKKGTTLNAWVVTSGTASKGAYSYLSLYNLSNGKRLDSYLVCIPKFWFSGP